MRSKTKPHAEHRPVMSWVAGIVALVLLASAGWAQEAPSSGDDPAALLRQGERIYREGIGPDGEPIEAIVQGDLVVLGTEFTCISCHMSAGLGSVEGGVITTPTTGRNLYSPYTGPSDLPMSSLARMRKLYKAPPPRPAYDDSSLALVLRGGIDPAGRTLDPVMPRYDLDERAMSILIGYLRSLSSTSSPGVRGDTIYIATVITQDVGPGDRAAVLNALENFIMVQNNLRNYARNAVESGNPSRIKMLARDFDFSTLKACSLRVWDLKGPADTWRIQMEDYYRREPVFFLLSGMTGGEWRPVHEFCEANRIPCILPIIDFPVVSDKNRYTLYFSKGFRQEGEAAARFLRRVENLPPGSKAVQVLRNTLQGRTLAGGFGEAWATAGGSKPVEVVLPAGDTLKEDFLAGMIEREKPAVILLWLGGEVLPVLEKLSSGMVKPGTLFLSASLLKDDLWRLPASVRPAVRVTYPFKLPQEKAQPLPDRKGTIPPEVPPFAESTPAIRALAATRLMTDIFSNMKDNYFGDYILDLIDMMGQSSFSPGGMGGMGGGLSVDFGKLGFGPGQRYAGKGCYIVELAPLGEKPQVLKRSEWVIH